MATLHEHHGEEPGVTAIINILFSPQVMEVGIILGLSSLSYRLLGIVHVSRNKIVKDGEKALWIPGFIFIGFITAIVFLVLAKDKKLVA